MGMSTFQAANLVKTGDVVSALVKYGSISLFGIAGIIFMVLAIQSWREYLSEKKK